MAKPGIYTAKQPFFCRNCHARIQAGEHYEVAFGMSVHASCAERIRARKDQNAAPPIATNGGRAGKVSSNRLGRVFRNEKAQG